MFGAANDPRRSSLLRAIVSGGTISTILNCLGIENFWLKVGRAGPDVIADSDRNFGRDNH